MNAPRVLLGVAGGIAAYKACELLRRLTERGHAVRVVPTASAICEASVRCQINR